MTQKEREKITDLKKCNFREMCEFFKEESEKRKNRSKEEKLVHTTFLLNLGALSIFLIRRDHRLYVVLVGRVFAHALGAFVVWHFSLPSMNCFSIIRRLLFSPCKLCFPRTNYFN